MQRDNIMMVPWKMNVQLPYCLVRTISERDVYIAVSLFMKKENSTVRQNNL
jgi:hypothetical protein